MPSYVDSICTAPVLTYELRKIITSFCTDISSQKAKAEAIKILGGKRILLVEDVKVNCRIVTAMLTPYGLNIETAENGATALEMIKSHKDDYYDCAIMDIQMPVMDGYDCSCAIRNLENDRKSHIPIIAMTANVFSEDRDRAAACGMNAFLTKPVHIKQLIEALTGVISD